MTAYATRAELRELALLVERLAHAISGEQTLTFAAQESARRVIDGAAIMSARIQAARCGLDAPPPARTVTRAQYHNAVEMLAAFRHSNSLATPGQLAGEILTALDLRVADDDTEAASDA